MKSHWTKDPKSVTIFKVPTSLAFFFVCLNLCIILKFYKTKQCYLNGRRVRFHLKHKILSQILFVVWGDSVKKENWFWVLKTIRLLWWGISLITSDNLQAWRNVTLFDHLKILPTVLNPSFNVHERLNTLEKPGSCNNTKDSKAPS